MYTTICTYHIVPEFGSELKRRIQAEFEPLISRLPGLVGYYLLKVSADQVVSVSIFDSKGKADIASGPMGFWMRRLSSALGDCILGLPEIVSGQTEVYCSVEARSQIVPTTMTWRDIITKTIVISPIVFDHRNRTQENNTTCKIIMKKRTTSCILTLDRLAQEAAPHSCSA